MYVVTLRTCASESQHHPLGPLSRKEEQSFQLLYPIYIIGECGRGGAHERMARARERGGALEARARERGGALEARAQRGRTRGSWKPLFCAAAPAAPRRSVAAVRAIGVECS